MAPNALQQSTKLKLKKRIQYWIAIRFRAHPRVRFPNLQQATQALYTQ
uniref:Uncharacterized protein n=1 Tax=Arundo donax TaxID=35708 RepID=A0A0A9FZF3_ARUDO